MRRNVSLFRVAKGRAGRKFGKLKPYAVGAAFGAVAAVILVVFAAGAQDRMSEVPGALPRNLFIGAAAGVFATFLGARPMVAALTAGTGIYLANTVRTVTSGGA